MSTRDEAGLAATESSEASLLGAEESASLVSVEGDTSVQRDVSTFTLAVKWSSSQFALELPEAATIADVKRKLSELTRVNPSRQKLIGLTLKGKTAPDNTALSGMSLKKNHKVTLIGTPDEELIITELDLEADDADEPIVLEPTAEDSIQKKLRSVTEQTEIHLINPPRQGKKLLVLDIDYTIFDVKTQGASIDILMRPYLHQFLAVVYEDYDIVIWSQTKWGWIEAKLTEMGVLRLDNDGWKIAFVLDKTSMFTITSPYKGKEREHHVKPLNIIWSKFPNLWGPTNTIHVDDLSRNFALNPKNGLKVSPYRDATKSHQTDCELSLLSLYLKMISIEADFSSLNLTHWKDDLTEKSYR